MAIRSHGLFRKVDHPSPDVALGGCYVDRSAGPGVDTGVLIEFEGTLFLSLNTIKELAEVAGFSVNEEGQRLEQTNIFLERELQLARDTITELNDQLNAVGVAIARAAQR